MVFTINPEFAKGVFVDPEPTKTEIDNMLKRFTGNISASEAARAFADDLAASVRKAGDQLFRNWVYKAVDLANHPDNVAASELLRLLRDACNNEKIQASTKMLEIASTFKDLFAMSLMGADVDEVLAPVVRAGISKEKSRIAKNKNTDMKVFVAEKWKARVNKSESKAAFSRLMVIEIKREFKKNVGADAIARNWIPK